MATLTTNLALIKPALTDSPPDITATNPNWDKIDTKITELNTSLSNVMKLGAVDPTTSTLGMLGQLYKNTTSGDIFACIKITNGTDYSWRILPTGMELGISLLNGWVNADGGIPIAFVRTGNVCHIYGMVSGGVQTGNTIICKIPQTLKGYYSLFARVSDGSVVGLTATGYDLKIVSSGWNIGANLVYIDIVYNCTKEV